MNEALENLADSVGALASAWEQASPASFAGSPSEGVGRQVEADFEGMTDSTLISTVEQLQNVVRAADALRMRAAAEVGRRSRPELGPERLCTRQGSNSAPGFLSEVMRVPIGEAAKLQRLGERTASGLSFSGAVIPPPFPTVAAALTACTIGTDAAAHIVRMLESVAPRADRAHMALAEESLVHAAETLPVATIVQLCRAWRDRLDEDGVRPREDELRSRRALTRRTTADGMTELHVVLDPESAGIVVTAVDGIVSAQLHANRENDDPALADGRELPTLRLDALVDIARHALGCEKTMPALRSTTVVVRTTLEELTSGLGTAEIDGVGESLSASSARRLAASADVIPVVLGGPSEVLDLGRSRRSFTRAQRIALAERDGGCAWPGCPHPPGYTEAHHLKWWLRDDGPTDLCN
ncbi:HNH endonuclease signature motif containing protein, partial [Microterricola pindariensis]